MSEGGDADADEDGDGDGDEVQVQPPPHPLFYPFPSSCKRPPGKTQRSAARQLLPLSLPKFLKRAPGQTNQFLLAPTRVTGPCTESCADFFGT